MALPANALVTVAAVKNFIAPGGMGDTDTPRLEEVIGRVSTAVERHCNRPLKAATYTGLRLKGPFCAEFFLRHTPIDPAQAVTVTINGVAQTVWRSESDGDPALKDVTVARSCEDPTFTPDHLYRSCGWFGGWGNPYNVVVGYTGGFAAVPLDLEEAALEIVKKVWNDQSKGLQDVTAVTLPSGGVTLFDAPFPRRALQLLERYRRPSVG